MNVSLTITGSPAALAAILAALPGSGDGVAVPVTFTHSDDDDGAPADPNAPSVDSAGLPWDERIHSSSRKTKADGTWTVKRGASKELIAQVEAELRGAAALPAPVPMPQPVPMPPVAMATPPMPTPQPMPQPMPAVMPTPQPMPQPVAQPMPQPVAQPMPQPVASDFASFMGHLVQQMQAKDANGMPLVHADYLASVVQRINEAYQLPQPLDAITALEQRPDLIPYATQVIQTDGRW